MKLHRSLSTIHGCMTLFCLHTTRLVELFCAKLEQSEAVCCTHTQTGGKNENLAFLCEGCAIKGEQDLDMRAILFFQLFDKISDIFGMRCVHTNSN